MGILDKLFGSSKGEAKPGKTLQHNGYLIVAKPFQATGGWQLAGEISKGEKLHKYVRADQFSSKDEAEEFAIVKGKLIIDQLGESMFTQ